MNRTTEPVRWLYAVLAGVIAMIGSLTAAGILNRGTTAVLAALGVGLSVALGELTQRKTTALSDPRAADGTPLVPAADEHDELLDPRNPAR